MLTVDVDDVHTRDAIGQETKYLSAGGLYRFTPHMVGPSSSGKGGTAVISNWIREIDPGKVFDLTLPLDKVADGYRAMDERRAVKVLLEL